MLGSAMAMAMAMSGRADGGANLIGDGHRDHSLFQ
jgi:hypothetical protein